MSKRLLAFAKPELHDCLSREMAAIGEQVVVAPLPSPKPKASDPYELSRIAEKYTADFGAMLLVAPRNRSPRRLLAGPVVNHLPVGIMLADKPEHLAPWLRSLHLNRAARSNQFAVLAMWKRFYLKWGNHFIEALESGYSGKNIVVNEWFADKVSRPDLCNKLRYGPELVIYVGHGRSRGWSGYRGLRWEHVIQEELVKPIGTIINLTCDNLRIERHQRVPFGLNWIYEGRACSFFGSVDRLRISPLVDISTEMKQVLASGNCSSIGEVIAEVDRRLHLVQNEEVIKHWESFRLVGNPLQEF